MMFPNSDGMKQGLEIIVGYIIELCNDRNVNVAGKYLNNMEYIDEILTQ
ncbi:hypothetical protein [Clostridium sp.]|nr:hypothetical protein [Clostridium sp.]MDR3593461.1 hypothetical protein [Clostridium sp.]